MSKVYDEDLEEEESFFGGGMGILIPLRKPTKKLSMPTSANEASQVEEAGRQIVKGEK
jgi:hypothetical protein